MIINANNKTYDNNLCTIYGRLLTKLPSYETYVVFTNINICYIQCVMCSCDMTNVCTNCITVCVDNKKQTCVCWMGSLSSYIMFVYSISIKVILVRIIVASMVANVKWMASHTSVLARKALLETTVKVSIT